MGNGSINKPLWVFLILILASESFSQSSDRLFHSIGTEVEVGSTPINAELYPVIPPYQRLYSGGLLAFVYKLRCNIIDISDELALSASLSPGIKYITTRSNQGYNNAYNGAGMLLNAPLMVNINKGAGSTYMSKSDWGGFFGLGLEYYYIFEPDVPSNYISNWMQSCLRLGFRFWRNDRLEEVSLKLGYGPGKQNKKLDTGTHGLTEPAYPLSSYLFGQNNSGAFNENTVYKSRTITLTYSRFLNY